MSKKVTKKRAKQRKQPTLVEIHECIEYFSHVAMEEMCSEWYHEGTGFSHLRNAVKQLTDATVELKMFLDSLD